MSQWKWADPSMATLFIVISVLALAWFYHNKLRTQKMKTWTHPRAMAFLFQEVSRSRILVRQVALILGFVFLILGLMRLQSPGGKIEIRSEGIEIVVLADVSESMMAEDLRPNRLSQMKYDLTRFVDLLGGHQVGLVAFAGSAHLLSPLTSDPNALKMYIDSLSVMSVSSQGTDIGLALEVGLEAFERGGKEQTETAKVTRAFLVVSDGEDHEPETLKKIKAILEQKEIRVFSVAYGSDTGATIPERDSLGYLRGQKRNRKGDVIVTKVNGDFLRSLSEAGGGSFEFAVAGGDHIKKVISRINQLEKRINQTESAISYNEHFAIFGWLALVHFLVGFLLPLKKADSKRWIGRVGAFFIILFAQSSYAEFATLRGWYHYKQALKAISEERYGRGLEAISQALLYDPQASELQNAIGLAFAKTEQWDQAEKAFAVAESLAKSPEEQFTARFNKGVIYQAQQQVDPALEAYLKALEIKPDSKETKINIELLIQQMQGKGKGQSDSDEPSDGSEGNKDPEQDPQRYQQPKPQPKQFKSEELSQTDMKRILEELRNQEQKIRSEFNKKDQKDQPREKDW